VAHVDDLDPRIPHPVEDRHDVPTAQDEGLLHSLVRQRLSKQRATVN
jgi:hypothetical protein